MIATELPNGLSALNTIAGTIDAISSNGSRQIDLVLYCAGDRLLAEITRKSFEQLKLHVGQRVFAVIKTVSFERNATLTALPNKHALEKKTGT